MLAVLLMVVGYIVNYSCEQRRRLGFTMQRTIRCPMYIDYVLSQPSSALAATKSTATMAAADHSIEQKVEQGIKRSLALFASNLQKPRVEDVERSGDRGVGLSATHSLQPKSESSLQASR